MRPLRAHRLTVFGVTLNMAATSDGRRSRSSRFSVTAGVMPALAGIVTAWPRRALGPSAADDAASPRVAAGPRRRRGLLTPTPAAATASVVRRRGGRRGRRRSPGEVRQIPLLTIGAREHGVLGAMVTVSRDVRGPVP